MGLSQEKFYSDLDLQFNIHPMNNDISVLYDDYSINQSIYNIIMSNKGDAKFHPEKCVGIRDMLFEPINILTESELRVRIEHILTMWMPRINLQFIDIETNRNYDGYEIIITYRTINIVKDRTTTLFLDRIR